jgi:hypothetical protein
VRHLARKPRLRRGRHLLERILEGRGRQMLELDHGAFAIHYRTEVALVGAEQDAVLVELGQGAPQAGEGALDLGRRPPLRARAPQHRHSVDHRVVQLLMADPARKLAPGPVADVTPALAAGRDCGKWDGGVLHGYCLLRDVLGIG